MPNKRKIIPQGAVAMLIDKQTINRVAELAQLEIPSTEVDTMVGQLDDILTLMTSLDQVDTSNTEALSNPLDARLRLRQDVVTEEDNSSQFQSLSRLTEDGLYLVPKVIEEK